MKPQSIQLITSYDDRRDIVVPGNQAETLIFCTEHFVATAKSAISTHGKFAVALSGGSTPKAIFQSLASPAYRTRVDWKNVLLFWSDERCVPPGDPESNYHMAMEAGFSSLPILPEHIFRMPAERKDLEEAAKVYEAIILSQIPSGRFDLMMLGMGEDGHTASLFPKTQGLHETERLVVANYIPQKSTWRMTLSFPCINASKQIAIYVIGRGKASMLNNILTSPYAPDSLPIQHVGTSTNKALWISDKDAASDLDQYTLACIKT